MAKVDFCFTYYDGDATRDTAHMNRLERGAYHDIVISIRKFGHLSLEQIKKILGRDFDETFPAVDLILKKDDENKYFIEWLDNSIIKSKKHSKKQSENRFGKTKTKPNNNQTEPDDNLKKPLGDGYEDGNGNEDGNEYGNGKEKGAENQKFIVPQMQKIWTETIQTYTPDRSSDFHALNSIANFILRQAGEHDIFGDGVQIKILNTFQAIADVAKEDSFWVNKPLKSIANNIQEFYNKLKNGNKGPHSPTQTLHEQVAEEFKKRYGAER